MQRVSISFGMHEQPLVGIHSAPVIVTQRVGADARGRPFVECDIEGVKCRLGLPIRLANDGDSVGNPHDVNDSGKTRDGRAIEGRNISAKNGTLPDCRVC